MRRLVHLVAALRRKLRASDSKLALWSGLRGSLAMLSVWLARGLFIAMLAGAVIIASLIFWLFAVVLWYVSKLSFGGPKGRGGKSASSTSPCSPKRFGAPCEVSSSAGATILPFQRPKKSSSRPL